jgi:hypothetical protein
MAAHKCQNFRLFGAARIQKFPRNTVLLCPFLLDIKYGVCKIGYIGCILYDWPEGGESEPRLTSHSLSVEYAVIVERIAYESAERHRVKSRSPRQAFGR